MTAVGGVAYGVIGANLHVFVTTGAPLYLLASWPAEAFGGGRTARLRSGFRWLRRWRDEGPRLAVRWLHGEGAAGFGPARLAARLTSDSRSAGWLSGLFKGQKSPVGRT